MNEKESPNTINSLNTRNPSFTTTFDSLKNTLTKSPSETLKKGLSTTRNMFKSGLNTTGSVLSKGLDYSGFNYARKKGNEIFQVSSQQKPLEVKIDTACTLIIQARVAFLTALPFLAIFGASTASAAATVGTGGAAAIAIVFVIAVTVKIIKKTKGVTNLNKFLKMITILFTQLLITNAVIMELSTLFNIQLNQSLIVEINNRLNNVTKLVLSLAPVVTKEIDTTDRQSIIGTLGRKASNIMTHVSSIKSKIVDNTHKLFNQDRLTAEILKEVNIINSLFIGIYTQLDFQLRETELVCIHDDESKYDTNEKKQCTLNIDFTNYKINDGKIKKMDENFTIGEKSKKNEITKEEIPVAVLVDTPTGNTEEAVNVNNQEKRVGGTDDNNTVNNSISTENVVEPLYSYREAYLHWIKNSDNYKKLKAGNMEEISNKLGSQTEGAVGDLNGATIASLEVLSNNVNMDAAVENCIDSNHDGICDHMQGGGKLFFFDDIRKMLQKNGDAINSFLKNRNARKTRKGKRIHKTRNGRKARKHSTVYKRKARKPTNTRKNK